MARTRTSNLGRFLRAAVEATRDGGKQASGLSLDLSHDFGFLRLLGGTAVLLGHVIAELLTSLWISLLTFVIPAALLFLTAGIWSRFSPDDDPRLPMLVGLAATWVACIPAYARYRANGSFGGYGVVAAVSTCAAIAFFIVCVSAGWVPILD